MKGSGDIQIMKYKDGKKNEEVNLSINTLRNLNKIHVNIDNNVQVRVKKGGDGMT